MSSSRLRTTMCSGRSAVLIHSISTCWSQGTADGIRSHLAKSATPTHTSRFSQVVALPECSPWSFRTCSELSKIFPTPRSSRHLPEPVRQELGILVCELSEPGGCHCCSKHLNLEAWLRNWVVARAANGHFIKPRLPPREGRVVGMEGSSVGVGCGQECGVYKSGAPSLAPETSGLGMVVVYLLQFFKLGVPLGIGGQIFLLSSWKQRWV